MSTVQAAEIVLIDSQFVCPIRNEAGWKINRALLNRMVVVAFLYWLLSWSIAQRHKKHLTNHHLARMLVDGIPLKVPARAVFIESSHRSTVVWAMISYLLMAEWWMNCPLDTRLFACFFFLVQKLLLFKVADNSPYCPIVFDLSQKFIFHQILRFFFVLCSFKRKHVAFCCHPLSFTFAHFASTSIHNGNKSKELFWWNSLGCILVWNKNVYLKFVFFLPGFA